MRDNLVSCERENEMEDRNLICPACGQNDSRYLGHKHSYSLMLCGGCGSIAMDARTLEKHALTEFYDHYYDQARFEVHPVVAASLERLVSVYEPYRSTGRWLDVGFGEGALLDIADRHGWSCYGIEISPACLDYGASRGWAVSAEADVNAVFAPGAFDVITMIEFLEHVPTPGRFLRLAAQWLRPGGLLYITTPNARSLNRWFLGVDWSIFSPPEHLTIWTAKALRHALNQAGFQPQRVRTEGLNPAEMLARLRPSPPDGASFNRNEAAYALNGAFSHSAWRRTLKRGINRGLSVCQLGDALKVSASLDPLAKKGPSSDG